MLIAITLPGLLLMAVPARAFVGQVVDARSRAPIANAEPIFNALVEELKVQTDMLDTIINTELPKLNAELKRLGLAEVNAARPIS